MTKQKPKPTRLATQSTSKKPPQFRSLRIVGEDCIWYVDGRYNRINGKLYITRIEGDITRTGSLILAVMAWAANPPALEGFKTVVIKA